MRRVLPTVTRLDVLVGLVRPACGIFGRSLVHMDGAANLPPCLGRYRERDMGAPRVETGGWFEPHARRQDTAVGTGVSETDLAVFERGGQGLAPFGRLGAAYLEDVAKVRPALDHDIELCGFRSVIADLDLVVEPVGQEPLPADMQLEIQKLGAKAVDQPGIGQIAAKARVIGPCIVAQLDQAGAVDRQRQARQVAGVAKEQPVLRACLRDGRVACVDLAAGREDGEEIAILQHVEIVPRVRSEPIGDDLLVCHSALFASLGVARFSPCRPPATACRGAGTGCARGAGARDPCHSSDGVAPPPPHRAGRAPRSGGRRGRDSPPPCGRC